jgi:hypothetical protein
LLVIASLVRADEVRRDAEGRRTLHGVERGDPSARAGAKVVQSAAGPKAFRDSIDGSSDLAQMGIDRVERAPVFCVHQLHELERRQGIDLISA